VFVVVVVGGGSCSGDSLPTEERERGEPGEGERESGVGVGEEERGEEGRGEEETVEVVGVGEVATGMGTEAAGGGPPVGGGGGAFFVPFK